MTSRFLLGLFIAFLFSLAPEAAAQDAPTSPNRWAYVCSEEPWGGDTRGFTLVTAPEDAGCAWRDKNDAVVQAEVDGPNGIGALIQDLDDATHWLSRNGFRRPHMTEHEGKFVLLIYPAGGGACYVMGGEQQCIEPTDKVELQMSAGETDNMLFISSDALRDGRAYVLLSLMYTVEWAYDGFSREDPDALGAWVSRGIAYGFADWWIKKVHGTNGVDPALHRHSRPLTASGRSDGRQVAPFWVWTAGRDPDGFAIARVVLEAASGAAEEGLSVIDAIDIAMEPDFPADQGPVTRNGDGGLSNAFWQFIWRNNAGDRDYWIGRGTPSGAWDTVAPEAPLSVGLADGPVERTISGHEPLAAVRVPIRVTGLDGRAFGLTLRRWGHTEDLVTFFSNEQGGSNMFRMDPAVWGAQHEMEVALKPIGCEDGTSCEFDVYFVNANKDQASATGTHRPYTLEVEASRTCVFPQGAVGVTYAAEMGEGRSAEQVMRMTMRLPKSDRRWGARTSVKGTMEMGAGGIGIKRDFTANLMCDDATFWIENMEVEGLPNLMGGGGAQVWGARLQLPRDAEVGMRLGSVNQSGEITQGGGTSAEFSGGLTDLQITGRERKRIGNVGEVTVWKIEGYTSSRFQMQPDGRILPPDAEVSAGLNEGSTREDIRAAIRQFGGEETNTPITIYYSPVYGAVETVTGWDGPEQVTHRLVEMVEE